MAIKKVLLVEKRHAFEALQHEEKMRDDNKALLKESFDMHCASLDTVKSVLDELGLEITCKIKGEEEVCPDLEFDLAISVGGDGTFIAATHAIKDETPIIGVKSDTIRSRGIFCSATAENIKEKLTALLNGEATLRRVSRIHIQHDGVNIPIFAVNEVLVTSHDNLLTARYELTVKEKTVAHLDSGLLVCTGSGSTAWMNSALRTRSDQVQRVADALGTKLSNEELQEAYEKVNSNLSFPSDDTRMQFLSREGIVSSISSNELQSGFSELITIRSRMQDGVLVIDSKYKYPFTYGDIATLQINAQPLVIVD